MKQLQHLLSLCLLATIVSCNKGKDTAGPEIATTYKDTVFTQYFRRTSGLVAADGAVSTPLSTGKSLWLFGDSHINGYNANTGTVPCLFQVHNAGLLLSIADPQVGAQTLTGSGSPASYFALGTDNNYWFWPGVGYQRADTAYTFLERIHATGSGLGFERIDSLYVGRIQVSTMAQASYARLGSKAGISFTKGVVNDGGYNYVYGTRNNGFGNDLFVARFPEANLYAPWEYYNGTSWTTNITNAAKIHDEFTSSFHVLKLEGKYVLLTTAFSLGCDQGKEIYSYIATNSIGPFLNKKTVWTLNDTLQGHYPFFYLAYAHPEYDNGKRELLVTYCINGYGNCVNVCVNNRKNPDYYRPRAIRVPFSIIGL